MKKLLFFTIIICLLFTSCKSTIPQANPSAMTTGINVSGHAMPSTLASSSTPIAINVNLHTPTPTWTDLTTRPNLPTITPESPVKPTQTIAKTATVSGNMDFPEATPVYIGTTLPDIAAPITKENLHRLTHVAQWGRGSILGVAFSPDGSAFVVGSASGIAIYDRNNLAATPRWVPFEPPLFYWNLFFSRDGDYLRFEFPGGYQTRRFSDGQVVENVAGREWLKTSSLAPISGNINIISPDGTKRLKSYIENDELLMDVDYSIREVYDNNTEELLYQLPDGTIQVEYWDTHMPEGCDLRAFSYSGNVFSPRSLHPYRAAFSPSGGSLAILYRAPSFYYSNRFSTMRIYRDSDGELLSTLASLKQPVETFAYAPDGKTILLGFVDGSIQLWDIDQKQAIYNAWHFNASTSDLEFSSDGKYLVLQKPGTIEVRLMNDGSLRGRYQATAFALSPQESLLALGEADGTLRVIEIESGENLFRIQAHQEQIYALAFSPDGQELSSSGQDCKVRSWEARSGQPLHFYEENWADPYEEDFIESRIYIYYLEYVPGRPQLIGYGSWSRVVSWDTNSGATQYQVEPDPLDYYEGMVTIDPHFPEFLQLDLKTERFYVDGSGFYNLESGEAIEFSPLPGDLPEGCLASGPISADGNLLFTRGFDSRAGQICILDIKNLQLLGSLEIIPTEAIALESTSEIGIDWLSLSPNGGRLFVNMLNGVLHVFQIIP